MSDDHTSRRRVLRTSGTTLATLGGLSTVGSVGATPLDPPDDGDPGDGGGGGGGGGTPPDVKTFGSVVLPDGPRLDGGLLSLGSESTANVWFEFGPEGGGYPYDTALKVMSSTGGFCDGPPAEYDQCHHDSLSTMDLNGTYQFRAVASNSYGKVESGHKTFTV